MEAKELLESWVKKIHKMRPFKDKWRFFKYGVKGKFKEIREEIVKFNPPKWDDRKAFIEICDNRIDRLKNSTTEIVTSVGALIAVVAVFLIRQLYPTLTMFLLIFVVVLMVAIFYYRAQMYAWYAVKEGVLLVKEKKNSYRTRKNLLLRKV